MSQNLPGATFLERLFDRLHHLILPTLVLAAPLAIQVRQYLAASLAETYGQDYIVAARARGIGERRLLLVHALRPSLGPVIQLMGITVPTLLVGTFVVEYVFAWPGLGTAMVDAVEARDHALVLAITLLTAIMVVLGSVLADWAQQLVDPRIKA